MMNKTAEELIATPLYKYAPNLVKEAIEQFPPNIYYEYQGFKVYIRDYRMPSIVIDLPKVSDIILHIVKTDISRNVTKKQLENVEYCRYFQCRPNDIKEWKD